VPWSQQARNEFIPRVSTLRTASGTNGSGATVRSRCVVAVDAPLSSVIADYIARI
jgi:hypothetical protein